MLAKGNIMEIDLDDEPEVVPPSLQEMIDMCQNMKEYCIVVCEEGVLDVVMAVCQYQGYLQRQSNKGAK